MFHSFYLELLLSQTKNIGHFGFEIMRVDCSWIDVFMLFKLCYLKGLVLIIEGVAFFQNSNIQKVMTQIFFFSFICLLYYKSTFGCVIADIESVYVFLHLPIKRLLLDRYTVDSISTKLFNRFPFSIRYVLRPYQMIL